MTRGVASIAALISLGWLHAGEQPRTVWSGPGVNLLGGPSRDGRFLSFVDPNGNLAVRDLASGIIRQVTTKPAGSKEFAYFSALSPDSARIAYAWFNDQHFYELRVSNLDGSGTRTLYRNEEAGFVQPCAWTPDGSQILTLFFRSDNISQIALVPAAGGPPRILRSLNWVYPKRMDLSPDGRSIVYDSFAGPESGDRTVYLLAVDGAREVRLIDVPGNHLFPLWTPDSAAIVYASDQGGSMDIWKAEIRDGKIAGKPHPLAVDAGRILPLGITASGDYYFGVRSGQTDVFVTDFEHPAENARRATIRYPGRNTAPAWSPDGRSLAYLSRRGSENFGQESRAIVLRSVEQNDERELLPKLAHMERVRWRPDGRALLVSGSDGKGRGGLFSVDTASAEVTPLVAGAGASFRGVEGAWTPDAKTLLYIHDDSELRARSMETRQEKTVYQAPGLHHVAVSPDGRSIAVATSDSVAILTGENKRVISFAGATELEWGTTLVAARGSELWRLDSAEPTKLNTPGNRNPGFSLHPDGKRIALTAGNARAEVRVMRIANK